MLVLYRIRISDVVFSRVSQDDTTTNKKERLGKIAFVGIVHANTLPQK